MFRAAGNQQLSTANRNIKDSKDIKCLANENRSTDPILTGIYTIVQSTVVSLLFSFPSHKASQFPQYFRSASPVRLSTRCHIGQVSRDMVFTPEKGFPCNIT